MTQEQMRAQLAGLRGTLQAALAQVDALEMAATEDGEDPDGEGEDAGRCPRAGCGQPLTRGIRGVSICSGCGANVNSAGEVVSG